MFNQYHVVKKSNKTFIKHNLDTRLCSINSNFDFLCTKMVPKKWKKNIKTTYSLIVEQNQMNCWNKNCRTSQQSPMKLDFWQSEIWRSDPLSNNQVDPFGYFGHKLHNLVIRSKIELKIERWVGHLRRKYKWTTSKSG